MTYRVSKKKDKFNVVEKDTDLIVATRDTREEAKTLVRSLNLGGGFNGFTPEFFTQDFSTK